MRAAVRDFLLDHYLPRALCRDGRSSEVRIALFHAGRCGSTVLGELLAAQGEVFWAGEIFEAMPERYGALARAPQAVSRILRRSQREPCSLRALVRPNDYPRRYRVYGFETKYRTEQHLRPDWIGLGLDEYLTLLDAQGFEHFVVLHRYNHLRKLVSGIVGARSGKWHTRSAVRDPVPVPLPVDDFRLGLWRGTLIECLHDLDAQYTMLLTSLGNRRVLRLNYEEHVSVDPAVAYRLLCDFAGIQPHPVVSRLQKTNPFPLERTVSNWREVVSALRGTPYEWMLDAEHPPSKDSAPASWTGCTPA